MLSERISHIMEMTEQGRQLERLHELVRARGAMRRALESLNEEHGRLLRQIQLKARELARASGTARPVRPREESLQAQLQRLDQELHNAERRLRARAGKMPEGAITPVTERRAMPRPAPIPLPDLDARARAERLARWRDPRSMLERAWGAIQRRKRRDYLVPY